MRQSKGGSWGLLKVFASTVRVEIVKLLLSLELVSLSDIAKELEKNGVQLSLPGLLKHMNLLEDAGVVRKESGWVLPEPDARKAVYLLEGKERVERILQQLEDSICDLLATGETFKRASGLAKKVEGFGSRVFVKEKEDLNSLLSQCESQRIYQALTEDEKKKVKLWRIMLTL